MKTIQLSDKAYKEMVKTLRRSREVLTMMRDALELNVKLKNKLEERDHAIEELKIEIEQRDARLQRIEEINAYDKDLAHTSMKKIAELRLKNLKLRRELDDNYRLNNECAIDELKKIITFLYSERWLEEDFTNSKVFDFVNEKIEDLKRRQECYGRKREENAG